MAVHTGRSIRLTPANSFTDGVEGPSCDAAGNLYVMNYSRQGTVGRMKPDGAWSLWLELPTGSIGNGSRYRADGVLFIADYVGHTIYAADIHTGTVRRYAHDPRLHQPNDLALDARGRLYASDPCWNDGSGRIWRIDLDGRFSLLADGLGTTNGIEVSPDGSTLYVNETVQRRIWAYSLNDDGTLGARRLVCSFPDFTLDGMRCDIAGNLYVTRYGKGVVNVIAATGEPLYEVALQGRDCTNLTFGGSDGRTCYVTVADTGAVEVFRSELPGRCWALARS